MNKFLVNYCDFAKNNVLKYKNNGAINLEK